MVNPFTGGSTGCLNCGTDAAVLLRTCQSCTGDEWPAQDTVVNCTPHAIMLHAGEKIISVPPSGTVARVAVEKVVSDTIFLEGVPVTVWGTRLGEIQDLPEYRSNVYLIVSRTILEAVKKTSRGDGDLVCPDDLVRDAEGRVIGARAFAQ